MPGVCFCCLLWIIASIGHIAWTVHAINFMHSTRYRTWWIKLLRKACHLIQLTGPFLFLILWLDLLGGTTTDWLALPPFLIGYVVVMWGIGGVYVPWILLQRWTRPTPAVLCSSSNHIFRFAQRESRSIVGKSLTSMMARLPGNQCLEVDRVERTLLLPQLPPAWDGLTLLHLSDLHLCGVPDLRYYEMVGRLCGERKADFLFLTGDLVDSDAHYHWLRAMLRHIRWRYGAYAILGNHDTLFDMHLVKRELFDLGITAIGGGWTQLDLLGEHLILVGNETPWIPTVPDLANCPKQGFRLCLSHSPDTLPWAKRHDIDLMLCGHTHGGQIRVPGIGPIFVPSRFGGRYDQGVFHEPPTVMYVSRGLAGTKPVRFFCRPEVTWISLKAGALDSTPGNGNQIPGKY